jgi:hypothetical protein
MSYRNDPYKLLYEAITSPKKKLAFFVGAGISIGSGLKDFKGFSKQFLGSIGPANWIKGDNKEINIIIESLRPEVLIQIIQQVHGNNCLEFYNSLDSGIPNPNHYFLALALLRGHCIFTTNVDTLIEKACENIGVPCTPIFYETLYRDFLQKQPVDFSSQLFKLHGSIESNKAGLSRYKSIRFTLDRVGLGLGKSAGKTLSNCLQERDFVFLGYSGNDHFSVHPELLKVDSDQNIYWFKFSESYTLSTCDSANFQNQRNDRLNEALKGSSTENWACIWEDISLREILIKWEPRSNLFEGNSSYAIEEILNKLVSSNEDLEYLMLKSKLEHFKEDKGRLSLIYRQGPDSLSWINKITDFKRHLCAAMLFIRACNLTLAYSELKYAEECDINERERAEIEKLRATTKSITRRTDNEKPNKDDLQNAIETFKIQGDLVAMIEARLELANASRIDRDFDTALEILDKIENDLIDVKSKLQKQKKAYHWSRLMAYLFLLRGLVCGLGQKGTLSDKILGINYCDKASEFASQAGDVARKAAALNARGLIVYQLAERTNKILQEAEISLNEALALHAKIRDPHSCFQPSRNLLLVYRLHSLQSKSILRDYWLKKACEEAQRAQEYIGQVNVESPELIGDKIELDFRKAQLLGLKGYNEEAVKHFTEILGKLNKKNENLQARIYQEILSLAKGKEYIKKCLDDLLTVIETLFHNDEEIERYKNDLLPLEGIRDMLIDSCIKAYEIEDQKHLSRIKELMNRGKEIGRLIGDSNLISDFEICSSMLPEEGPCHQLKDIHE